MFQRANALLATGQSVVLDATFISAALREQAATLAVAHRATYLNVFCDCPAEIAKARIAARMASAMDASEGRPELYDQQAQANEPQTPRGDSFSIDSRQAISIMGAQVLGALQQRLIPQP
jgi:predicted kinase